MALSLKLGLMSLVSVAAAVPHSAGGGHSRFHSSGTGGYGGPGTALSAPYPTGGWGGHGNHTRSHGGAASGASHKEPTTTILQTQSSTETVYSTVYATRPAGGNGGNGAASSVGALGGASGAGDVCGPATVTVTATNKITVTVPAGGAPASSAIPAASSIVEANESPSSKVQEAAPSSAAAYTAPAAAKTTPAAANTSPAAAYSSPAAAYTPPAAASSSAKVEKVPSVSVSLPEKKPTYAAPASSAASSAAQPSSTGYGTGAGTGSSGGYSGGTKRGLAYNDGGLLKLFDASKFAYAYNWESIPKSTIPQGIDFIPTLHPMAFAADFKANVKGAKTLFTFNEPDHAEGANFAPTEASCTNYWEKHVSSIISENPGMTIVAPAITNANMSYVPSTGKMELKSGLSGPPVGLHWLELFKQACPKAVAAWSQINIHYYDIWDENTVARFQAYYNLAVELNPGKKIWVTEIGLNPGHTQHGPEFLPKATKFLDSQNTCSGYNWFKVGAETGGTGFLANADSSGLNALGQAYNA